MVPSRKYYENPVSAQSAEKHKVTYDDSCIQNGWYQLWLYALQEGIVLLWCTF